MLTHFLFLPYIALDKRLIKSPKPGFQLVIN